MTELCPHCREFTNPIPHRYPRQDELVIEYQCEKCHKTIRATHIPIKEGTDEPD